MNILSIILFFAYTYGIGYTVTYFVKNVNSILERHLMRIGIGLGVLPIVIVLINFLRLPLDWLLLLIVSLAFPIYSVAKNKIKFNPKITKSDITVLIVILLFIGTFGMYLKGAFSYPYLENEDPWGHSVGVKYVSIEKSAYDPDISRPEYGTIDQTLSYIDPYPPGYDGLLGILHQTNDSVQWTMKFFNALIISLSIIFFYFFAKQFSGNRNKALFSTFVLAAIPCYLSHFIWAHSLVITIFFPMMYAFERIKVDKKWTIVAGLIFASVWVTQNISQPLKFSILLLVYLIVISVARNKLQKHALFAMIGGFLVSFLWWGVILLKYGFTNFFAYYAGSTSVTGVAVAGTSNVFQKMIHMIPRIFAPGGSASRAYVPSDFLIAQKQNLINNPIGIGIVISILTLISIIFVLYKYKNSIVKNSYLTVTLFWLIYTFLGVNGQTFHISISPGAFRIWMLMAIPIALICAEGMWLLYSYGKKVGIPKILVLVVVVLGIWGTSGYQKYYHNTNSGWPTSGSFSASPQNAPWEYGQWFGSLEPNTKVFLYAPRDKLTIGYDAYVCEWCQEVIDFRRNILDKNVTQLISFLKSNRFEYLVLAVMDARYLAKDENSTAALNQIHNEILSNPNFKVEHNVENNFVALKVL